jgi:hypothetical protein
VSWRILFARRDGVDVGFAKFRRTHKWERARPAGELAVWALVGDPAAQLALLRRLVDLPEALQDRTWSAPCDLVVEVADPTAPWNDGSWRIRADAAGEATVERTEAESDLRLDGAVLAAAYLGGGNLVAQQRAGLVAERRRGAVAELWRAMRTDVSPTAAFMF